MLGMLLIMLCLMALSSCRDRQRKYVIAVSQCSNDTWRDKLNDELKTAEYFNDSIEVRLAAADDSGEKQQQQIDQYVKDGVDLLIVSPVNLGSISSAVQRAYGKGIHGR